MRNLHRTGTNVYRPGSIFVEAVIDAVPLCTAGITLAHRSVSDAPGSMRLLDLYTWIHVYSVRLPIP